METIDKDHHGKKGGVGGRGGGRVGGKGRGRGQYISQENQRGRGGIMVQKSIVAKETHPKRK